MKISACYITKNESANIASSIESLAASVDEIIVYDTGSSDDTCRIVEQISKVRLFCGHWQDDFAAARNKALLQATGDWVVFLDADERFSKETRANLRAVIEAAGDVDALAFKILNIDTDGAEEKRLNDTCVVRAFRRLPSLRYVGRIHEHIECETGNIRLAFVPQDILLLLHTGYTKSRAKKKAERNLKLLLQELSQTKTPEDLYRYLAEAYEGIGDTERALYYARLDIAKGPRRVMFASRCYRLLLYTLPKGEERSRVLEQAQRDFPQIPEFHAEYAEYLAQKLRFVEAISAMQRAFHAYAVYEEDGEAIDFNEEMLSLAKERVALWQEITQKEKTLKISACTIARDEERDLPRWLKNTAVYSDERIVVDTGSHDATKAVSKAAGAHVYDYLWHDDFAAAKNEALSHATGEWVAFLDADEYFAMPEMVRPYLAALSVEQPQVEAVMLTIANLDEDDDFKEFQRFSALRVFRRQKSIAFSGRVHEAVRKKEGSLEIRLEREYLLVYHLGYSSRRIMKKIKRNFALLKADIKEHGEKPEYYHYLVDCYIAFKDWKKALYYALAALDSPVDTVGSNSSMYQAALYAMRECKMSAEDMLALTEKAIETFSDLPDFYAEKGIILSSMGKLQEATKFLEYAIYLHENENSWQASRFREYYPTVWCYLGKIYLVLNNKEKAKTALEKSLLANPFNKETLDAWQRLWDIPCSKTLRAFFPKTKEAQSYLARWAIASGEIELAGDAMAELLAISGERLPETACLAAWQAGDWQKMADEAAKEIVSSMQDFFLALLLALAAGDTLQNHSAKMQPLLPEMQEILHCFAEKKPLAIKLWETYSTFLPMLVKKLPRDILLRYVRLLAAMPTKNKHQAAKILLQEERYHAALELLTDILSDTATSDGAIYHDAAVAFYHAGDFSLARQYFSRAKEMGSKERDIAAYERWLQEVRA